MRFLHAVVAAAALGLAAPVHAQDEGEATAERQVSEDGRLQQLDAAGNPVFDAEGNPVWEASAEERSRQLFEEAVSESRGLAAGSTAWQFAVIPKLTESLSLDPDLHQARYNLGLAYLQMNDLDGAIAELEKVIEARAEMIEARIALGIAYERSGRLNAAEMLYARGLAEEARNVELLNGQARVLLKKGRLGDAETSAKSILRVDSNSIDAFNTLGLVYIEMGRFETARFVFQTAGGLTGGDTNATLRANLGLVWWKLGKEFRAEAAFTEALELDPNHAGARVNLAHIRLTNLDYAGALELLEPVSKQLTGNAVVQMSYAVALRGSGRLEEAQAIYEELAADPDSPMRDDALLNLGILQGDFLKDPDSAIDSYNEYIAVRETQGEPVGEDDPVRKYLKEVERAKARRDRRNKPKETEEPAPAEEEPAPAEEAPADESSPEGDSESEVSPDSGEGSP